MIEPDPEIAGLDQRVGDRLGLLVAREAVGQRGLVDLALMFLEGRERARSRTPRSGRAAARRTG